MIPKYRKQFNQEYSTEKYQKIIKKLEEASNSTIGFRNSESPIFLSADFKNKLLDVSNSIITQIKNMSNDELLKAVPQNCIVPNDTDFPELLTIDFGICRNENGEIEPQLIELQAFPTMYAYQEEFECVITEEYPFLQELRNSIPKQDYINLLKEVIIGEENPENVVLLEIYPEKQKTAIDFALTKEYIGIETVCLTKVKRDDRTLFYEKDGKKIEIKRIYNRVIFDELLLYKDLDLDFDFTQDVDVKWITHPNWFFKVSKFILPKLHHQFIPKSYFLDQFPAEEQLENYVLKPLFSFAGSGVDLYPTAEKLAQITDKENFIMQRKVSYHPLFEDINGEFSKAEIRLLYLWKENEELPQLMDNLVRMTKAEMVNVDFNKKDAIWIGSSIAFFEK